MTAFNEVRVEGVSNAILDIVKQYGSVFIWKWYHEHEDDVIWHEKGKIRVFGINIPWSVTITVRRARPLVERIAGPEPTTLNAL